jgi:2',3'-cyclic-nucleotide 2'-phosphodiesterase/3'-nucleotidase
MVLSFYSFLLKFFLLLKILTITIAVSPVTLSDYKYPSPERMKNRKYIAIMGTNDIHGEIFPNLFDSPGGTTLSTGGATNIYSYVKAMRKEWGDSFIWLDGGDQFQGTMEVMLSDGSIMKDFYNYAKLDAIAIGNHEFDYGIETLKQHIKNEKFPTLCANLYDKKNKKYIWEEGMWENVKPYHIFSVENPSIKIGVIGLATAETTLFTATDLSDYIFDNYYDVTKRWTDFLRKEKGVDAVILLTHFGPKCPMEPVGKMELGMRNKDTHQEPCDTSEEIMSFLKKVESEELKIDALVGAHVHDVVHHWIHGIPCIESSGAGYFNILYLPFRINDDESVTLINDEIEIEGPVPVCEKIWDDTRACNYKENEPASNMRDILFHNSVLEVDQGLFDELDGWYQIINKKRANILAETQTEISLNGEKETVLTNLINDIGRMITGADICFYNLGGIRHSWHKGGITEIDVFKMFPFNNTWNMFEMTGEEVIRMFKELNTNVIYPATGVTQTYLKKNMQNILRDIELWDGVKKTKIDLNKTYKICTNNFLADGGTGMSKIRRWYDLRNNKVCGIIRDSIIEYFRNMKVIKKEFYIDSRYPNLIFLD